MSGSRLPPLPSSLHPSSPPPGLTPSDETRRESRISPSGRALVFKGTVMTESGVRGVNGSKQWTTDGEVKEGGTGQPAGERGHELARPRLKAEAELKGTALVPGAKKLNSDIGRLTLFNTFRVLLLAAGLGYDYHPGVCF
ncbi:hypothetical protein FSOLCH5_003063 [Fusarium solani]